MRPPTVGAAVVAMFAAASARAEPLRLDLGVGGGWSRIADATDTPVLGGDTESEARSVVFGLSARLFPYRHLVAVLGYEGGRTRSIAYEGTGTRRTLAGREVGDVEESFSRFAFLVTVTWRLGGAASRAAHGDVR